MKRIIAVVFLLVMAFSGCINLAGDTPVVYDKPIIKTFTSTPSIIDEAASSMLSWNVAGATNVYIDQGVGNVALTGSTSVAPRVTTIYTLTAANSLGTTTAGTQITIKGSGTTTPASPPAGNPPAINYFTASPTSISSGSPVTLSWSIFGATDIKIVPEIAPAEAEMSVTVFPTATTTYTLKATNAAGSVSKQASVIVSTTTAPQAPGEKLVVLNLLSSESGSMVKSGASYSKSTSICAGDNTANLPSRAFLSFDISSIPLNAVIKDAVLDFGAYTVNGNPIYSGAVHGNMGAIEVYREQYGKYEDLGRLAYEFPAAQIGTLRWECDVLAPLKINITRDVNGVNVIQALLAESGTRCQFRVQFFTTTNWDSKADSICFEGVLLRVNYSVP